MSEQGGVIYSANADFDNAHYEQSCFFSLESEATADTRDGFVSAVTTVAQSQCERATNYEDIETLPDQSTFWRAWNDRFSSELCAAVLDFSI